MKSRVLSLRIRQQIAKHKEKYPQDSSRVIADKFKCTTNQVYRALKQDKAGLLKRKQAPKKTKDIEAIIQEKTTEEIIEDQYKFAAAQLVTIKDMPVENRTALIEKFINIRKSIQHVKLESHIKRIDANIIASIIRRYEPEADDDRVIKVYREEFEKCKN
jgi:hypothetical protein